MQLQAHGSCIAAYLPRLQRGAQDLCGFAARRHSKTEQVHRTVDDANIRELVGQLTCTYRL
jgi:hypothetical protein